MLPSYSWSIDFAAHAGDLLGGFEMAVAHGTKPGGYVGCDDGLIDTHRTPVGPPLVDLECTVSTGRRTQFEIVSRLKVNGG